MVIACGGGGNATATSPPPTAPPSQATIAVPSTPISQGGATTAAVTPEVPATATNTQIAAGSATTEPTPGNLPQDLANAVNQTKAVQKVRFEIASNATYTQNGQPKTEPGIMVKGEGNGADQHISFSGPLQELGGATTFEFIETGGAAYEKGLNITGLDANVWYQFPKEVAGVAQAAPNAKGILSSLDPEDFRKGDFKDMGIEILDAQPCRVWTAQSTKLAEDFGTIAGNEEAQAQLKAVDKSDFRVWTCSDGFLHKISGTIEGHNPDMPSDKAKADLTFHIYDFGADITISPPPNAQRFQIPGLGGTPTP
jgi:hypothetical protein